MSKQQPRILMTGGGTGGHLFPALAIAEEIKKISPGAQFLFVGTKGKIEARVVPERGYDFRTVWISGFSRSLKLSNLLFPVKVFVSIIQSWKILKQFKPDVVVGTGGYVCGPILFVASVLKIPTVIHESNSYPGVTTRMLASRMTAVFTGFESTLTWLKRKDNVSVVGMPTRPEIGASSHAQGAAFFGVNPEKPVVLVFGGSLGAASINKALLECLDHLAKGGVQIIWQTGKPEFDLIRANPKSDQAQWIGAFIERMDHAYAAADIVVCRSGASTLAELALLGKPAILVPYPFAAADHQTKNAEAMVASGAAMMLNDRTLSGTLLNSVLDLVADEPRRINMQHASKKLGRPNAGHDIAQRVLSLLH